MVFKILREFNDSNSLNYKRGVLEKHINNELLMRVFNRALDSVKWTYGITMKNIQYEVESNYNVGAQYTLDMAMSELESKFCTREITGSKAIEYLSYILSCLSKEDAYVLERVIERDLKIGLSKTEFNKIAPKEWKCVKPAYMRCELYNSKTAKNIDFSNGAYVQLKADGTYREFTIQNETVTSRSRSGEEYEYPIHFKEMQSFKDGVYVGELTVNMSDNIVPYIQTKIDKSKDPEEVEVLIDILKRWENKEQFVLPRGIGNGLINSDTPPHEDIILDLWDYVTLEEYSKAVKREKCTTPYETRFKELQKNIQGCDYSKIKIIPTFVVNTLKEALEITSKWMSDGLEGSVLKDKSGVFKDGTSKHQLKLKLKIEIEVRCTGFTEGRKGTKREQYYGAMTYENDEGTIKGRCSGFNDTQLKEINSNRDYYIGKIITVSCCDITKAQGNKHYALSHPAFEEVRLDKTETDTLEKAFLSKEMAMELSDDRK